jgi:hypothetical protein
MGNEQLFRRQIGQSPEMGPSKQASSRITLVDFDDLRKENSGGSRAGDREVKFNPWFGTASPAEEHRATQARFAHWKKVSKDLDSTDPKKVMRAVEDAKKGYSDWRHKPNPNQNADDYFKNSDGSVDLQKVKDFIDGFIKFDEQKLWEYNRHKPPAFKELIKKLNDTNT